jgi:hypothetical protein
MANEKVLIERQEADFLRFNNKTNILARNQPGRLHNMTVFVPFMHALRALDYNFLKDTCERLAK